jgi:hypothetical protein
MWKLTMYLHDVTCLLTTNSHLKNNVRFQVLKAASMKTEVFCDVVLRSLVEIDWRFRDAYSSDDGWNKHI